jgi:hypothetical protein
MAAVGDEMAALRAEVLRLKELLASKDVVIAGKDEVIASKNEVIASRNEVIAGKDAQLVCKDDVIACKKAALSRTAEELQCTSAASSKPAAAAVDNARDCEQPSSKRQRMYANSSSSSFQVASPLDRSDILNHVFCYVGGGDHLYIGGVNRQWRGR